MSLCSRLVVAPALRESETVMDAGVELDLAAGISLSKQHSELLDHRQRCQIVVLGAGDVEFRFCPAQREMWAFVGVADEPCAVIGGGGSDALGVARRRG